MLEPEPPSPCLVGTVGRVWPLRRLRGAGPEQEGDPTGAAAQRAAGQLEGGAASAALAADPVAAASSCAWQG